MGNASSVHLDGDIAGGASRQQPVDVSIQGSTKSWAIMDHTLSGPWSFLVKEEVQCLCEGGRNCSHENPSRQQGQNAIPGLHSSWVGDQVLAMARPWQENVLKYDVVSHFKEHNIGMILNLQEVGEHDSCGPGNLSVSGFTYNPETFMAAKIGVYNISWRDMGVPTLEKMMDIVQIMQYTTMVECRKVAVHCHAGLGRTGLAIACFLVGSGQASSAEKAVEMVRAARPGSLQTPAQVMFVSIFEQYLQHLRCLFKVADLKHLSLGNTNYIVTKVCRRISRSMSGQHQFGSGGTPDALAAATAALGPLAFTPAGSGGSSVGSSIPGSATAAAAAAQGQPDWASATYELMSPSEAAQLATPAEAAANAALNLGQAAGAAGAAQEGLVMHARRLSGGGNMKLVSNLKAIEEEGDKPVHVIQTDNAVTEVYGHGLTIIRATDSTRKLRAPPKAPGQQLVEEQLPTPHELGLDRQLPWNDRFAIRPEAFKADGWLPEPPSSYLEALRRQQRLLHGTERRRCLHQHKLLRSAAKALAAAAEAYKSVPVHTDAAQITVSASGSASPATAFKRTHSRSRSNAAAIDLLALAGGLNPSGSGIPQPTDLLRSPSNSGSIPPLPSGAGTTAAGAFSNSPGSSLLSKQQQQQQQQHSPLAGHHHQAGTATTAAPDSAAALLPGLQLGPPGTTSSGISTSSGGQKLSRQGSGAKGRTSQGPASAGFFIGNSTDGSTAAAGTGPSCTPCLAGCCAPSFAVGLLIALLYKGRFPEEYEAQWSCCPHLKALGLDEGHAVCQSLQAVKLAVNAGCYSSLESASGAVAVCVLADWFEGFKQEAFSEATLELLVDDAEALLAAALARGTGAGSKAHEPQQQQQQQGQGGSSSGSGSRASAIGAAGSSGLAVVQESVQEGMTPVDDPVILAQRASARAMCSALAPYEQDLCLLLAAMLRHARHASLEDPRLQEYGLGSMTGGSSGAGGSGGRVSAGGGSGSQWALVEAQVDAAMAVLYRLVAGWLLGPLALACVPALEAVAAFLHYLSVDDTAYGCLLQAIQQGVRRARSAPAGKGLWDSLDSGASLGNSTPRGQQQQNMDRLEKLKARLLGTGSSFKLKPVSSTHKASKQSSTAPLPGTHSPVGAHAGSASAGLGAAAGAAPAGASSAAGHSIGKSKLRHASSSPELCSMQQQQQPQQGSPTGAKHAKSKLGVASASCSAGSCERPKGNSSSLRSSLELGGAVGQGTQPEADSEPKGCANALTHMLSHKLHSLSSKKHQQVQQQMSVPGALTHQQQQQQQQPGPAGSPKAASGVQQQVAAGATAAGPSPRNSLGSSCGGDSISELIHAGNYHELCVGQQADIRAAAMHIEDELAVLSGQQPGQQQHHEPQLESSREGPGVLDSPPRSVSPEPPSASTAAGRRRTGQGSSGGGSGRQQPLNMHVRLPPMQRNSLEAMSDAGSSFTSSPCSSLGSITGMLMAAQQYQGVQQHQPAPPAVLTQSSGAAAAATTTAAGASAQGFIGSTDLSGNQAVSVSALSDLVLQSPAASKASVSQQQGPVSRPF